MASVDLQCKYCLAQLKVIGENHYRCESCGNEVIEKDDTPQELSILLVNAYQDLRLTKFDDALDRFTDIVSKYPDNYMAYWGLCLAEHGVVFVEDRIEEKMVPTCYNMEIKSFLDNPNYRKAIELAPAEQVKNYEYQASKIELIRKEWIEKANAIPPYDIFISFKHRDEDGNVTSDYEYLNDLWHELTYKHNLNVFFSPQTLKDKVSEKFEPYIYRALHTSKIMLLYGEKPEYFETTWVKNEWTRYLRKIKNKEKHPKSLIVAYKNFNANLLPSKLKDAQALDANKTQFINILYDHINNILNLSQNVEKLERIEIKSTGISSRSRSISSEVIQKRELGSNYVKTSNTTVENLLNVVKLLINSGQFEIASSQLERARNLEPNNSEVKYYGFLIDNQITGTDGLSIRLKSGANQQLLKDIEEIINTSDKQTALSIIETIKSSIEALIKVTSKPGKLVDNVHENTVCNLFSLLSSYEYNGRKELNEKIINYSCSNQAFLKLFELSIRTLDQEQVDEYIDAHIRLVNIIDKYFEFDNKYITSAINISDISKKSLMLYYLDRVKTVDSGNGDVLHQMFVMSQDVKYLEETLKYCSSAKEQLKYLNKFLDTTLNDNNSLYEDILKYIPENEQQLYLKALKQRYEYLKTNEITKVSSKACPKCRSTNLRNMTGILYVCNQCHHKFVFNNEVIEQIGASERISKLKWYVKQLLQIDNNNSEWLYDLFKFDLGLVSDEELIKYSVPLGTLPEFNELLPNLNTKYQELVIQILNKQTQLIKQNEEQNKAEKERLEKERIRQENEAERKRQELEEKEKREKEERERQILLKKIEDENIKKANEGKNRAIFSLILVVISYIMIFHPLINEDFKYKSYTPTLSCVIPFINFIHCIFSLKYLKYLEKIDGKKVFRTMFWISFIFSTFMVIAFIILMINFN